MHHRFTLLRSGNRALVLSAVFPALCVYGFMLWWIHMSILIVDDFSAIKAMMFEPWLGPFHLAHILTFMNVAWVLLLVGQAAVSWRRRSLPIWRPLGALASALMLVIAIQFWVHGFDTIATRYDNDRILSDQEMVQNFDEQRNHFEAITSGIRQDMRNREDDGASVVWEPGRWRWYWTHQKKIGIRRDITGSQKGRRVRFVDAVNAIGSHGSFKGYLYSEQPPTRLVANLDTIGSLSGAVMRYRRIADNWYLFIDKKP